MNYNINLPRNTPAYERIASMSDLAQEYDEQCWANGDDPDMYVQHIPYHGAVDLSLEGGNRALAAAHAEAAKNLALDEQARAMSKALAAEAAMKARQLAVFIRISGMNKHGGISALPGAGGNA